LWNIRGHPHGGVNPSNFKLQPVGQYIILQNTTNLAAKKRQKSCICEYITWSRENCKNPGKFGKKSRYLHYRGW